MMKTFAFRMQWRPRKNQRGVSLFFGALFLLTIILLALGGVAMSRYQQRLALAMNDREFAFQGASLALRAAEMEIESILGTGKSNTNSSVLSSIDNTATLLGAPNCPSTSDGSQVDDLLPSTFKGLCTANIDNDGVTASVSNPFSLDDIKWDDVNIRPTSSMQINYPMGIDSKIPGYIIEEIPDTRVATASGNGASSLFRITSIAWGRLANTQVRLQELYRPDPGVVKSN